MRRPPSPLMLLVAAILAIATARELRIRRNLDALGDWPRVDVHGPG